MGQLFACTSCNKNKRDNAPLDFDIGVEIKQGKGIENGSYEESDIDSNLNVSKEKLNANSSKNGDNDKENGNSKVAQEAENNDRIGVTETSVLNGNELVSEDNNAKLSKFEETRSNKEDDFSDENKDIVEEGINDQTKSSHITFPQDSTDQNIDHEKVSNKGVEVEVTPKGEDNQTADDKHSQSHIQENDKNIGKETTELNDVKTTNMSSPTKNSKVTSY